MTETNSTLIAHFNHETKSLTFYDGNQSDMQATDLLFIVGGQNDKGLKIAAWLNLVMDGNEISKILKPLKNTKYTRGLHFI